MGPAKGNWAAQYIDFKVISRGKVARGHGPSEQPQVFPAGCLYYKAPAEEADGGRPSCLLHQVLCSSLTSRQGELGGA